MNIIPHRLVESSALLPFLHTPEGRITVGAVGPLDKEMARDVLRWRDTETVYVTRPMPFKDSRLTIGLPNGGLDLLLLSPDQDPANFMKYLKADGIIQATSTDPNKIITFKTFLKEQTGSALPWREHLPVPFYGVLALNGTDKPKRHRNPPPAAKRLTKQYLPSLFTFGKDELGLVLNKAETIPLPQETSNAFGP